MEEIFLDVELREDIGKTKVNSLRRQGFIPAIVYKQGEKSQSIRISRRQFVQMMHQHHAENIVISLRVNGDKKQKARNCMIKEIQYDPVKDDVLHVDFHEISLTKAIKVGVPLVSKGEPVGVKQEGGSLEHILWQVEIECLPTDIPKNIEVDVSQLKIGDSVHIKEISFPPKVKVLSDPEAVVFSVAAPMKEEAVAEPVEGEEKLEPEVIKEKKEAPPEGEQEETKEREKERKETKERK